MKFYSLDKSIGENYKPEVIRKVEYFWHFWDFLFTTNRKLILVEEPKFISQISLLNKIEKHLKYNNGINAKKLLKYSEHDYFKKENLILRGNSELTTKVKSFKTSIQQFKDDRPPLLIKIEELKKIGFNSNSLSELLIEKLWKLLYSNKTLQDTKSDLKFLSNSIIDLLQIKGYSIYFIKTLLKNTILNPYGKNRFIYEKNRNEFSNTQDYDNYVESEFQKLNLEKRINYLLFFLKQDKRRGYHFFKIEGIEFKNDPIEIFDVKFYNPQKDKFLTTPHSNNNSEEYRSFFERRELFHSEKDIFNKNDCEDSTCNAMVPVEYLMEDLYFDLSNKVPASYKKAIDKVLFSINILKNSISYSSSGYWSKDVPSIRPSFVSILTNSDYCYHATCETNEKNKIVFELDSTRKKMFDDKLLFLNSINNKSNFLLQLLKSHSALADYRINFYFFDFKSIWIDCIEPFFNNYDELIEVAKKALEYRVNIFVSYQALLSNSFENNPFYSNYSLTPQDIEKIGLNEIEIGKQITGDKLSKASHLLPNISIIEEFKDEMKRFKESKNSQKLKLNNWIVKSIKSAYEERNIEVHYNLKDYYLDYGLKRDLLEILDIVIGALTDSVYNNKVTNIEDAINYISNKINQ
ncbi:hypothetical protein GCM10009430_29380 [Aquimarina litoralis]|uniref:Uncharacterized protein n=1 Tax=Aquimarina litoralis TaxID=584605 RepID=A0ABN1IZM6_9FLAO